MLILKINFYLSIIEPFRKILIFLPILTFNIFKRVNSEENKKIKLKLFEIFFFINILTNINRNSFISKNINKRDVIDREDKQK